jgi:hypothetical protein
MEENVCMVCGTPLSDAEYDESPYCAGCTLFIQWLELDKTVDHDGDAEVTDAERKQWEIEQRLNQLGLHVVFNLDTQQTELARFRATMVNVSER